MLGNTHNDYQQYRLYLTLMMMDDDDDEEEDYLSKMRVDESVDE